MPSLLAALSGVMKQFYAKTPVQTLMNDETNAYNLMSRGTWTWNGASCQVPWHIAHDSVDATCIAENGNLGTTGAGPVTAMLTVPARTSNKLMQVSGLSLDQVKTDSFLPSLQLNMQDTVAQVLNKIDRQVFGGGPIKVFLNQHKVHGAGLEVVWDVAGDVAELELCRLAAIADGLALLAPAAYVLAVDIIRTDTGAIVNIAGTAWDTTMTIAGGATDILGGQIRLTSVAGFTTIGIPNGVGIALVIKGAAAAAAALVAIGNANLPRTNALVFFQADGIYAGFSNPTYHAILRTTAALGSGNALGPVITTSTTGGHLRIAMTADTLAGVMVEHNRRCSDGTKKLDLVMVEPGALQEYASLVTQTVNFQKDISKGATSFDVGVKLDEGKMYGVPVKSYQRCGRGMAIFINTASWKMAELKRPGWSKYGGDLLRQAQDVSGVTFGSIDGAEGNYYWRGNFVNLAPNASLLLTGFDFAGSAASVP